MVKRSSGDREELKKQGSVTPWLKTLTCNTKKRKLLTSNKNEEKKNDK